MKWSTPVTVVTNGPPIIRADDDDPRPAGGRGRGTVQRGRAATGGATPTSRDDRLGPAFEDPRCGDQRYPTSAMTTSGGWAFEDPRRSERGYSDDDYDRGKPKKRKKSFLEEFSD